MVIYKLTFLTILRQLFINEFLNRIEIIVGHGELALYKKILYVLHYFQKSSVT